MHLVVDARMIDHSGIGVYLQNVLPRVAAAHSDWRISALLPARARDRVPGVTPIICTSDIYTFAEQRELAAVIPRSADLVWSPHYNVPLLSRVPLVTTIHDVTHLARPEGRGLARAARLAYARLFLSQVRRRARLVLFNSRFTGQEFVQHVGTPRASTVIQLGVDESWKSAPAPAAPRPHDNPYVLFVGSMKPHKNLQRLLKAFALVAARVPHDLVLVGALSGLRTLDHAAIATANDLRGRVRLVGQVDDSMLRMFMHHADALVFPSLYEGFGLPPLEAMAAGVPCVVSDIPTVRETCGSAAEYFDPLDPRDMANQIESVLTRPELRRTLADRGRVRATRFTWESTAEKTASALAEAASG
jgi:glycosyltransferase involved in cell wall biosynthesis